ncbi:hypothetical protein [Chloracidobacterium aggregatum]|nr:hypothetical protein [Chloracidobacterium aggregatum]
MNHPSQQQQSVAVFAIGVPEGFLRELSQAFGSRFIFVAGGH